MLAAAAARGCHAHDSPSRYLASKPGKHSGSVLLCLLEACSASLAATGGVQRGRGPGGDSRITYCGARVVFKKVDLQIWHWMSMAFMFCRAAQSAKGQNARRSGARQGRGEAERMDDVRSSAATLPSWCPSGCAPASAVPWLPGVTPCQLRTGGVMPRHNGRSVAGLTLPMMENSVAAAEDNERIRRSRER